MLQKHSKIHFLSLIVMIYLLTSCGGEGDTVSGETVPDDTSLLNGYFLDTAVEGLEYRTFIQTGENTYSQTRDAVLTDRNGKFTYKEGEFITFSIGYIDLFSTLPVKRIVTPYDLAVEPYPERPINIARFLQTLDNDNNLVNGISINDAVRARASTYTSFPGFNLGFEGGIHPIVEELTSLNDAGTRVLIDAVSAEGHLNNTISSAAPGSYPFVYGYYTGSYTINLSNCLNFSDNGSYNFSAVMAIDYQNQASFSGTAIGTISVSGEEFNEVITFTGSIATSGEISGDTSHTFVDSGGTGTFTGQLSGDALTISNSGFDTGDDTCSYTRNITLSR